MLVYYNNVRLKIKIMKTELEMIKENLITMTLSVDGNTEYSKGYLHALEFALKQIEILIKIK